MSQIFEYTDFSDDALSITGGDVTLRGPVWISIDPDLDSAVNRRGRESVVLPREEVTRLREALLPFDPAAKFAHDLAYVQGRQDAIDDHDYVTRERYDDALKESYDVGYAEAGESLRQLDPERVAALEKAAEIAASLRSSGPLGIEGAVTAETLVGLALFLLGQINAPGVSA